MSSDSENNVRAMVRVRPFNQREIGKSDQSRELLRSCVRMRGNVCAVVEPSADHEREAAEFDECFWSIPPEQQPAFGGAAFADQQYVYERTGLPAYKACLEGYNVCLFAYGQTGSGKTHSMLGTTDDPGISPRLIDDIFKTEVSPCVKMSVECTFFEIYNEQVRDLFRKTKIGAYDLPKIRLHPQKGVFVEGLVSKEVATAKQAKALLEKGMGERAMTSHELNPFSSRSHAVFQIRVTQKDAMKRTQRVSVVNLVDLAGSEKVKLTKVEGDALTEAKNINKSLSTLRRVVDTLIENSHIRNPKYHKLPPFRESVLTWVLSDSLGGNSKTQMLATVSPHECNIEETIGTLRYALRAKAIVCHAKVNEEQSEAMMANMRDEILLLQQKLREGVASAGGMSDEIKKQIEEREREVERMEEDHKEMELMLAEAKEREARIEAKFKEADDEKQKIHVEFKTQKKERFAAAFRNAFMISAEKKKAATSRAEIEAIALEKRRSDERNEYLAGELHSFQQQFDEFRVLAEQKIDFAEREVQTRDVAISQLKRQVGNGAAECAFYKEKSNTLESAVSSLQNVKTEMEKRVQRLQQELLASNAARDREEAARMSCVRGLEEKLEAAAAENDNTRKRKDKYKLQWMEAKARHEGAAELLGRHDCDRSTLLAALKAQQHALDEQAAAVARVAADKTAVEARLGHVEALLAQRETELRAMSEALREYQSAAGQWALENEAMSRELKLMNRSSFSNFALQGAAGGDLPSSPSLSPTRCRSASPRPVLKKPAVCEKRAVSLGQKHSF